MGVQVIVGQGWPHGEERFGRWSGEERKDLEGGQEASKVLKPAEFDLHSISNGKPWKASEQDMGNSTLGLSLLVLIHPTSYAAWLPGQAVSSSWYGLLSTRPGCAGPPLCPLLGCLPQAIITVPFSLTKKNCRNRRDDGRSLKSLNISK